MELQLVVRRSHWIAQDDTHLEYRDGNENWVKDSSEAWLYSSMVAFSEAEDAGGRVFIRLPSGREIPVDRKDFPT